jgi:hypothetical protein
LVVRYKRVEWILAAFYRKGYALERFAQTMLETPVPPEVKRLGEEAVVDLPGHARDRRPSLSKTRRSRTTRAPSPRPASCTHLERVDEEDPRVPQPLPPEGLPGAQGAEVLIEGLEPSPTVAVGTVDGNERARRAQKLKSEDDK